MVEATRPSGETKEAVLPVFEFLVEGISSLLMNSPQGMAKTEEKVSRGKNIPTPEAEAESKTYRASDGRLYLPSMAFRSAILYGCKGRKLGPKQFLTTLMPPALFNVDSKTFLVHPETGEFIQDYEIHATRVKVQGNGVIRHRPEIAVWGAKVFLEIDTEVMTPQIVEEVFQAAGRVAGVGDWRPQKIPNSSGFGGPHGRFRAELVGEVG